MRMSLHAFPAPLLECRHTHTHTHTRCAHSSALSCLQLLDEVLDYGYPQTTDPDALKILSEDSKSEKGKGAMDAGKISSQVTGQIGWRRQDIS